MLLLLLLLLPLVMVLVLVPAMLLVLVRTAQAKNGDNTKAAAVLARGRHGGGREGMETAAKGGYHSGYFLSQRT